MDGAVEGLTNGVADYFLWEKFTTKPLVDNGTFRCLGYCPTPWPCFVIAVRQDFLNSNSDDVKTILNIINKSTEEFKNIPNISKTIETRYGQKIEDVQEWLQITEWSQDVIDEMSLLSIQKQLLSLKIIPKIIDYNELIYKL